MYIYMFYHRDIFNMIYYSNILCKGAMQYKQNFLNYMSYRKMVEHLLWKEYKFVFVHKY